MTELLSLNKGKYMKQEHSYPRLMRLTNQAMDALAELAKNKPAKWLDPVTDFELELKDLELQEYAEQTTYEIVDELIIPDASKLSDREKHLSDTQAWEFGKTFENFPTFIIADPNLLAWLSHFPLRQYGLDRWPNQRNADLHNYVMKHYLPSESNKLAQSSVAGRLLWIVHTAKKAAKNSGGAFTAKEAFDHFVDNPEHYHTCCDYFVLRSGNVLAEFVRALKNEARGISRKGVRKLANALDGEAGARLLDALNQDDLRQLTQASVERVMSEPSNVNDRTRVRNQKILSVLSLGAGVQSTVMALMANEGYDGIPKPDFAIFADTGWEPKSIYEHLDWLKTQLDYEVVHVTAGNIKENTLNGTNPHNRQYIDMPVWVINEDRGKSVGKRTCTNEYKVKPIRNELRNRLGLKSREVCPKDIQVHMWLGISVDEASREKPSKENWITNKYPLIDRGYSRAQLYRWFKERYPDRALPRSACIGCPYHSDSMWKEMKENDPTSFADAVAVDWAIRNSPQARGALKGQAFLHKSRKPLNEVQFAPNLPSETQHMEQECEGLCGI